MVYLTEKRVELTGEKPMENFGSLLAVGLQGKGIVYLYGRLGAGKTTLCRGILRGLGHKGAVKSPTFTLVEPYELQENKYAYHFDLYRLGTPEELELMGARDYFEQDSLCLVEWPERGEGWLNRSDIDVNIEYASCSRRVTVTANSVHGAKAIEFI